MKITDMIRSLKFEDNNIKTQPEGSNRVTLSERIKNEILSLVPGKTIQGEVVAKEGNEVVLRLLNNVEIHAKLEQDINLDIGKLLSFEVKNNGKSLQLSPLLTNTANSDTLMKALDMASLPVSEKTLAMTEKMMSNGMSIDARSMQEVFRDVLAFPDALVEDVVNLHKLHMPVNEANLHQMESYRNLTHELVNGMKDVLEEIPAAVLEVQDTEGLDSALSMMRDIVSLSEMYKEVSEENTQPITLNQLKELLDAEQNPELIKKGIANLLKEFPNMEQADKEALLALTRHPSLQKEIREAFLSKWTLQPEMTENPEEIEKTYDRMNKELKSLQHIFTGHTVTADNPAVKAVNNLSQNIDFLNQLNQMYTYVQLPLKMHNGEKNSELYVFTNKKSLASKEGAVSAMLHLDMDHLGPVDVYVTMQEQKVGTRFMVKNDEMLEFLSDHMHILTERLNKRGYSLNCEMKLLDDKEGSSPVERLIESENTVGTVVTKGFDVRA